ncbi:hypothetical protein C4D60_Mb10t22450 [Musa balbisiana]|uniref:Dof zinc finger protein n=1 Tax=Musa balbisiana TaxID=52838 RepID=A0A4S8J1H9_MUSBA|nr:hypothetical protein C4D60_Mb10t22450 [Musa balbisiana]
MHGNSQCPQPVSSDYGILSLHVRSEGKKAMASHQLEGLLSCPKNQQQQERKPRPHPEQALKCPRCASTNTKFCYYNNYSLSQPRYFCKGCRRYWTQGGSLRNVPVGGGCRKNKRSFSSSSSRKAQDQDLITATNSFNPLPSPTFIPPLSSDLTLAFAGLHKQPPNHGHSLLLGHPNNESLPAVTTNHGFLDILRSDSIDSINPSGLDNYLYYGFGVSGNVEVGGGANGEDDGFLSFHGGLGGATATAAASQGSCKDMDEGETKVLMGGDGNLAVDSGREWTAMGSSWHGLINSSLMSGAGIDVSSTLGDAHAFF